MVFEAEINKAVDYTKQSVVDNKWQLALLGVLVLGYVGYRGYGWWHQREAMSAQMAFADAYDAYQRALSLQYAKDAKPADQKELWEQAEVDLKHGFDQYRHSSYAPYFKAFSAQVAAQQGNHEAAVAFMREAVHAMNAKNAYHGLYKISLALMLLDGTDAQAPEGLQILQTIADNPAHAYQDMALYYLGLWYQAHAEHDKALAYWRRMTESAQVANYEQARSPWRALIQQSIA